MSDRKHLLNDLRVIDLRFELEKRNLDKSGVRSVLIHRLSKYLTEEGEDPNTFEFTEETPVIQDMIVLDEDDDEDETEQQEEIPSAADCEEPAKMEINSNEKVGRKRETSTEPEVAEPKKACLDKDVKTDDDQKVPENNADADDSINLDLGDDELHNEESDHTTNMKQVFRFRYYAYDLTKETRKRIVSRIPRTGRAAPSERPALRPLTPATDLDETAEQKKTEEPASDAAPPPADATAASDADPQVAKELCASDVSEEDEDQKVNENEACDDTSDKKKKNDGGKEGGDHNLCVKHDKDSKEPMTVSGKDKANKRGGRSGGESVRSTSRTREKSVLTIDSSDDCSDKQARRSRSRDRKRSSLEKERDSERAREKWREAHEKDRRRRDAEEALRERERRQRHEKHRLALEREKLKTERERFELEKNEVFRLEREKLELERLELMRAQLRWEEERRKRDYEAVYRKGTPSPPPAPPFDLDASHKRSPLPPRSSGREQLEAPFPPRFGVSGASYERPQDKRDYVSRDVFTGNMNYPSYGSANDGARQPLPPGMRPKQPSSRPYEYREPRSYRSPPPFKPELPTEAYSKLPSLRQHFEERYGTDQAALPTFDQLKEYIDEQCRLIQNIIPDQGGASQRRRVLNNTDDASNKAESAARHRTCTYCESAAHTLYKCSRFKKLDPPQRKEWARNGGLCFKCLRQHLSQDCTGKTWCKWCNATTHNSMLCTKTPQRTSPAANGQEAQHSAQTPSNQRSTLSPPSSTHNPSPLYLSSLAPYMEHPAIVEALFKSDPAQFNANAPM